MNCMAVGCVQPLPLSDGTSTSARRLRVGPASVSRSADNEGADKAARPTGARLNTRSGVVCLTMEIWGPGCF